MDDIVKIEKEIIKKFKDKDDIEVFTDYDIDNYKLQILVEIGEYYSRIYYDINDIREKLNSGYNWEEIAKTIINRIFATQLAIIEEKTEV